MALGIGIITAFGFLAAYWKIRSINRVNEPGSPVDIVVDGYKDQAARVDGASPMASKSYQAMGADLDAINEPNETSRAYVWLKTNTQDFAGATDLQP